jgi:hypothetical protein
MWSFQTRSITSPGFKPVIKVVVEVASLDIMQDIVPIFIVPAIVGFYLLVSSRGNGLRRMAGWLTLKPIVATPIWIAILDSITSRWDASIILTIIPGAGLTLLIMLAFQPLLFGPQRSSTAWWLIKLDCVRWINSFVLLALEPTPSGSLLAPVVCGTVVLGLTMPTLFAIVVWFSMRGTPHQQAEL